MSRQTSFDELYATVGTVLNRATGRRWFRKGGIQAQPKDPYATVYLSVGECLQSPKTENVPLDVPDGDGHFVQQVPWGTMLIECQAEFFRNQANDSALQAALRFANSLRLDERFYDLWVICGSSGASRLIDISGMFRADVEPRVRVVFHVYANVADPLPLADTRIYDIKEQPITITSAGEDIDITVLDTGEITYG